MVPQRQLFVMNPSLIPTRRARERRNSPETSPYDHLEL